MIQREISEKIKFMAGKMPVISITGPRQSGKTTLAKMCFPDYDYVNLENPDTLDDAISDPRLFLSRHKKGLIIDEIQIILICFPIFKQSVMTTIVWESLF
jgi:uncharacterized protein